MKHNHFSSTDTKLELSRREAVLLLAGTGVVASGLLAGCGGSGAVATPTGTGRATLEIIWPELSVSRLIPVAASSITVSFSLSGTIVSTQTVARPSSGNTSTLSFTSLPPGALTVTATAYPTTTGTGVAQATATTTATIVADQNTTVSVTMASTISALSISPTSPALTTGSTTQLTMTALNASGSAVLTAASTVSWQSSNTAVATVDATGLVTGVSAGSATITVTESESGKSASTVATVSAPVASCHLIPTETDGPYPLYSVLSNAAMVRSSIAETKTGVPLTVELTLVSVNGSCGVIKNAYIYIWHCDKDGTYSGYSSTQNGNHLGETYCRGIQQTDSNGKVTFQTIYPGWYAGRITHVHFQVYLTSLSSTVTATSQFAFPQDVTQTVYASSLYAAHGQNTSVTSFSADNVFSDGTTYQMATLTGSVAAGYTAKLVIGVNA
ncbi:Ig-like domain-containing protein [Armatimonas rosea]|uniref:Protocatechuate 3,4-dioxygenase beta subunit n=1 Tax=Armatimonas rosea TaxID=685828 RepID=A0A7W9SQY7_ARMRO|nr:Ig-like domain-containing protein [Armatimonas rosea]MBB6051156.1 protocatechuate 3,4-dioxygenase beta subunit [Armatimonas rosea]